MKVRQIKPTVVAVPIERPIISYVRKTDRVINVLIEVGTDEGLTGVSYVGGFTPRKAAGVCALVEELEEALVGCDPSDTLANWERMWQVCTLAGHAGLASFAQSAVDIALWDLLGKSLGAPLHRLLGTRRRSVQAYASDGCWLGEPSAVASEAEQFAKQGFGAVKVRVGRPNLAEDHAALCAVRSAVGPSVRLMVDANQAWTRAGALAAARVVADVDPAWLEEPLVAEDVEGLADLRARIGIPITAGENAYMPEGVRRLIQARAVDTVMPDVQRVGGVTGWIRANALAELNGVEITSHLFPEISVHLLASSRVAGPLEWVDWARPLLRAPAYPVQGVVEVPDRPGLGIEFDHAAVSRYRVD